MTTSLDAEPWRELPVEVADAIEPALPAATREILAALSREVPEYARPLEGAFGRGLRRGVDEALGQFVALIRDPDAGREAGRGVYVELGRGELRQGRTLDSLQSAYRVGARAAWRHIAGAGRDAGLDPEVLSLLAESIFAYIDELSADSVEGYAQAASVREGERLRLRRALLAMLLREPPAEEADVRAAALAAGWKPPASIAALACPEELLERIARRLRAETLTGVIDGIGCALIGDPAGPGQATDIAAAADGLSAALGPAGERGDIARSWALASAALRASQEGSLAGEGLIHAERRLPELLLLSNPPAIEMIAARRLAPLEELTPKARTRMRETALAYIEHRGNAAAMAREMHVHPQTARYRIARLRELLGETLEDPDGRFELELALRAGREAGTDV